MRINRTRPIPKTIRVEVVPFTICVEVVSIKGEWVSLAVQVDNKPRQIVDLKVEDSLDIDASISDMHIVLGGE